MAPTEPCEACAHPEALQAAQPGPLCTDSDGEATQGLRSWVGAGPPGSVLVSSQAIWFLMEVPWGFPGGSVSKEASGKCRESRFDTWVRKIRRRRKWQPSPVFLPGDPMDRGAWQTTVSIITTLCLSKKRREEQSRAKQKEWEMESFVISAQSRADSEPDSSI